MTATGYDGSIKIDSKIDEKGFNDGVKNMSKKVSIVGEAFKAMGRSVGGFFGNILKVVGTVITAIEGLSVAVLAVAAIATVAILGVIAVMAGSIGALFKIDNYAKGLKDSLAQLKVSFAMAFEPLVTLALPYIQAVVNWFIKLFNTIQMIVAAWLGQKTVMQATANTTKDAAKSTGQLAKNTKEAGKAAEGALASFDELNVLQMEKPETATDTGGGGGTASDVSFKVVPIDPEILKNVQTIQQTIENIKTAFNQLSLIVAYYVTKTLNDAAIAAGQLVQIVEYYVMKWLNDAATTAGKLLLLAGYFVSKTLNDASIAARQLIQIVEYYINLAWGNIQLFFANIWNTITQLWYLAGWWFSTYVTEPIRKAFDTALKWISEGFTNTFIGIKSFVKNTINSIISFLNSMISAIASGINTIISGLNSIKIDIPSILGSPAYKFGVNLSPIVAPQIPLLATGAVIPANAPFAAILGDQKSGTNIEAPEDLIRQIIRDEMGGQQAQRVTIDFGNSSLGALIRTLNPVIKQENDRIGSSLIDGVSA